ncbi:MAG: cytochrome c3, partial [Duodenibacillus sp.]|nr:cytochrome c3 [Duodenibacillus sp.]
MNTMIKGALALALAAALASGALAADGKMLAERHVGRGLPCQ